jgi:hypothetical protein
MANKLFIIGNGFDLSHGIRSGYNDFRDFVKKNDEELFDAVEENFIGIDLWSDFEEALAWLDTDSIEDDATNYLESYGVNDWKESYHHDYQFEIQKRIDVITVQLKEKFTQWVLQLENNWTKYSCLIPLPNDAIYLTFNYTTTLESLYKLSDKIVFHIHNKIVNESSTLILGHSRKPTADNSFNKGANLEDQDVRITEGNQILDSYFQDTYKSTEIIIAENYSFFTNLKSVEEVIILGHSLSPVDISYFQEIVKCIDIGKVNWKVTYHNETDKLHHMQALIEIGVSANNIDLIKLENLNLE